MGLWRVDLAGMKVALQRRRLLITRQTRVDGRVYA